jgi:V-type H+-transporting ATPase subunit a
MYTGLIYNEMFSVALDFGSNWQVPSAAMVPPSNITSAKLPITMERINPSRTYEFGVDPAWNGVPNTLNFYNSLKMKMSIILGVTQMVLGIILSAFNGVYFGHYIDIFVEFIPQLLFMLCLFGYMVFLIIYKWSVPYSHWTDVMKNNPPFLLNVMIQMFLSPVNLAPENKLFEGQQIVQPVLLLVAIISVPVMLLVKPLYLRSKNKAKNNGPVVHEEEPSHGHGHGHGDEEFDFSEVFVKQCIHTIEYVLGAISNTASYLRLWALSLAHSELSIVFWEKLLIYLYSFGENSIGIQIALAWVGWGAWAVATFGVLLVMES